MKCIIKWILLVSFYYFFLKNIATWKFKIMYVAHIFQLPNILRLLKVCEIPINLVLEIS